MKFDYDKENKVISFDGEGMLILFKSEPGINLTESFVYNDDFKSEIKNFHVSLIGQKGFKAKLKQTLTTLKYIWT